MHPLLRLCRPHQYVKNAFVLAPLFFANHLFNVPALGRTLLATFAFCLVASAVYVLNDLQDLADDRRHPVKRLRPLASGAVSVGVAVAFGSFLAAIGLVLAWWLGVKVLSLLSGYLLLNFAYSLGLKRLSLVDVSVIALGFVLRIYVGGAAADVPLSQWIVLLTALLALFLALAKRRDDLVLADRGHGNLRASLVGYNREFLATAMALVATLVCVAYLMYTLEDTVVARVGDAHLCFTALFVVLGFLRYFQITFVEEIGRAHV